MEEVAVGGESEEEGDGDYEDWGRHVVDPLTCFCFGY